MDGWVDGWMDGWTDGWMDGLTDQSLREEKTFLSITIMQMLCQKIHTILHDFSILLFTN